MAALALPGPTHCLGRPDRSWYHPSSLAQLKDSGAP
ncbi:rCG60969 [Rattus norvegicus]|uniref:RCG60969 n=1 Tax=Rattus norvegicus TaxID=10116 RepID=A6JJN2_RAT|nr:rCG60969 [Rattus norvegicus]